MVNIAGLREAGVINPVIRADALRIAEALGKRCERLAGKTALITGAAGFLCAYLLDVLAVIGDKINARPTLLLALDNHIRGTPRRLAHLAGSANVRILSVDVSKPFDAGHPVDFCVHGASIASPTYYRQHPLETIDANVNGTKHVLDLSRAGAESVVFLSSSEIYGDPDPGSIPTPEDYRGNVSCTGPRACYDESKRLGETLCVNYHALYKVPVKIIRPFNVYGPSQRLDDKRVVPDLVSAVLGRKPIVLHSDGTATRSFCYASDFIFGLLLVMLDGRDGEAYNVGNDEEISIKQAAEIAASLARPVPVRVEMRASQDRMYLVDNPQRRCPDLSKLRRLGYAACVPFREGLARTIESYAGHSGLVPEDGGAGLGSAAQ